jgi:O-antigen/teichoic acid export membrane protein
MFSKRNAVTAPIGMVDDFAARDAPRSRAWTLTRSMSGKAAVLARRHRGLIALCDQGVVSATNFATGVIIGRVCGKAELGVYMLAWTLITLTTEISATLTTTPYIVFSPQLRRRRRSQYLASILGYQLLLSMLFAMIMAAGGFLGSWRGWVSHSVAGVVTTTAGVITFINLREFVRRVSFANLRMNWALAIDVTVCLAQLGGMLLLLHFSGLTASRTIALLGMSCAVAAGAWLAVHPGAFLCHTRTFAREFKRTWQFTKWVLASCILSVVARYLYPWVLTAFHGTSVTGIWAACLGIVALGNPVLMGVGNYVGPKIANVYAISGIATMNRYVYRASLLFALMLLPVVLLLAGWGDRIVTGLYGGAYAGNGGVILLLALNLLITAFAYPFFCGLFTLERTKADLLINLVAVTLLFTIGIATVKSYAALGTAATVLVTTVVTTAIRLGVFGHEVRRRSAMQPPASCQSP